jgi:hypothetical protein
MPSFVGAALLAACSEARAPAVSLRPLEERRAQAIIERVVEQSGLAPKRGRTFELSNGFRLREDVVIGEGPWGIAYVSQEEIRESGGQIVNRDPESSKLRIMRPAENARVLVLYEDAYRYDVGEGNTVTIVTCEKTLEKDVADFIENAVKVPEASVPKE